MSFKCARNRSLRVFSAVGYLLVLAKDARGVIWFRCDGHHASRRVEYHFHAAVLLGFEGLIEIGAVSEIRAAVGDEKVVSTFFSWMSFVRGSRKRFTCVWPLHSAPQTLLQD